MKAKARVFLADDHPVVLAGLRNLIKNEQDLQLIGDATEGFSALRSICELGPDIAIIDITMPEINGIALTRRLREERPSVRVLLLTFHEDRAYINQALEAGARGYVLKRAAAENLIQAIRAVLAGGLYIDPAVAGNVFEKTGRGGQLGGNDAPTLTDRETQVLKFSALGFTNKEIARRLDVGVKSVETYKARGAEKLGLRSRAAIVRYAATQGWLNEAL